MKDGYHHLRIREGDERHTAFLTEYGLFEWTVVCFGLRNAPAEFARFMSSILMDYLNEFVVVYFDDIVIFSENEKEHEEHVKKVLRRLKEARINLKIKKCEFGVRETSFLGDIVNGDTTRMQDEKVKAILQWPSPKILSIWKSSEDWWDITGSISRIFYEESTRYLRKRNSVGRQRTKKYSKKLKTSLKETKYLAYSTLRKKSWCTKTLRLMRSAQKLVNLTKKDEEDQFSFTPED
jgi:Reverse transcriptase (RNA-dependent DNA polymerase)